MKQFSRVISHLAQAGPSQAARFLLRHQDSLPPQEIYEFLRDRPDVTAHLSKLPEAYYLAALGRGDLIQGLTPTQRYQVIKKLQGTPLLKQFLIPKHQELTFLHHMARWHPKVANIYLSLLKKSLSKQDWEELLFAEDDLSRNFAHYIEHPGSPLVKLALQHPELLHKQDIIYNTPLHLRPMVYAPYVKELPPKLLAARNFNKLSFFDNYIIAYYVSLYEQYAYVLTPKALNDRFKQGAWKELERFMVSPEHREAVLYSLAVPRHNGQTLLFSLLMKEPFDLTPFLEFLEKLPESAQEDFLKKATPQLLKVAFAHPEAWPEIKSLIKAEIHEGILHELMRSNLAALIKSADSAKFFYDWVMSHVPEDRKVEFLLHSSALVGRLLAHDERILDILEKEGDEQLFSPEVMAGALENPAAFERYIRIIEEIADPEHFPPYLKDLAAAYVHNAAKQETFPQFIAWVDRYSSPEEMLELLLKEDSKGQTPLYYVEDNREFLASYLSKLAYALAPNMAEKDRRTLSYVVGFVAEDHRPRVNTDLLVAMLEEMDWEADNWKEALFAPLLDEELARVFAHKEVLGKRGKWSRGKLMVLARAVVWEPSEELVQALKELPARQAYQVVKAYYLRKDWGWRDLVIKHSKEENLLKSVALDYFHSELGMAEKEAQYFLEHIEKQYPHLLEDILAWTSVFAIDAYRPYLPLFQHIFLLSPQEYVKERYKELRVPSELRKAWLKDYRQEVVYVPAEDGEREEQLLYALQNLNKELEKEGWRGPWLEFTLLKKEGFKKLREWEWTVLQNTPPQLYISLKPRFREIRSLVVEEEAPTPLTFLITDSRELLFRMGKGPKIYSCQAPDYWGDQKLGLLGFITLGAAKMAVLIDGEGQIIGRAKLYLLKKDGRYYVAVDQYYGSKERKVLLVKHLTEVLEKWKDLGLIEDYSLFSDVEGDLLSPLYAPFYTDIKLNGQTGLHYP